MAFDGPTELKISTKMQATYIALYDKGLDCNTNRNTGTSPYCALPPSSGPVFNYYPSSTSCIKHTINHKLHPVTLFPSFESTNSLKRRGNVYAPPVLKFKGTAAACGLHSRVPHDYHTKLLLFPYTSLFGLCNVDECCL